MLEAVATRMPKNPARPEQIAPTTNEAATSLTFPWLATPRRIATATTNMARTLYSRERKAMAPSRTAAPISFIRSVPGSCLLIQRVLKNANRRASAPPYSAVRSTSETDSRM